MKLRFLGGGLAITVLMVFLAVDSLQRGSSPLLTVEELKTMEDTYLDVRVCLMGYAREVDPLRTRLDFTIEHGNVSYPVRYVGKEPLPERLENGAETRATGTLRTDGVFEAITVRCKCGTRYEAESKGNSPA